jgi:hypothetical protein
MTVVIPMTKEEYERFMALLRYAGKKQSEASKQNNENIQRQRIDIFEEDE